MSHAFQDFNNPYSPENIQRQRPPQRSRMGLVIAAIIVLGGCGMLCCGGVGALGYFGLNVMTTEIEDKLRDNALLKEKVGDLQTFEIDYSRSIAANEEDVWVYQVRGTKGQGMVIVDHYTDDNGDEQIRTAKLKMSTGEEIDLLPPE